MQCQDILQYLQYVLEFIFCSFVAILVLIFVVIFVARHRFHRGMGGGGGGGSDCARRWRHEKPSGGATVEKVNGSIHVSLGLLLGCVEFAMLIAQNQS